MNLLFSRSSLSYLKRQDKRTRNRIVSAIDRLPTSGDIMRMKAAKIENLFRLRVGKFRVLYVQESENIRILDIDTRGDIYKSNQGKGT